jgi:hypothetical protein
MITFNQFGEVDPSVKAALGNHISEVYFVKRNRDNYHHPSFHKVYRLTLEVGLKLLNKMTSSNDDIVSGDKVFFVPGNKMSAMKLKDSIEKQGAKLSKTYDTASVIVFPQDIYFTHVYSYRTNVDFTIPCTNYKDSFSGNTLISHSDHHFVVDNASNYPKNKLPDKTRGTVYISPNGTYSLTQGTDGLMERVDEETLAFSGYLLNMLYYAAKNKIKIISAENFENKYCDSMTILDKESVKTIIQMFSGTEEDTTLASILLANSDHEEKPFYLWYIMDKISLWRLEQNKRVKDVKYFVENSNATKYAGITGAEFYEHVLTELKKPEIFTEDEYAFDTISNKMLSEYVKSLPNAIQRLIKSDAIEASFVVKLPVQQGVE